MSNKQIHYKEQQKTKQIQLIQNSDVFRGDTGDGVFRGKKKSFVLRDGLKNLYGPIVDDVLHYFTINKISWWGGKSPTGHTLSSQIACLNHLFSLRNSKDAVVRLLKTVSPDFIDVLEISTDAAYTRGYIQFEAVADGDYLKERRLTRGANITSVDALIIGKKSNGAICLVPIEWKYTEKYGNDDKSKGSAGETRKVRYHSLLGNQLKTENLEYYHYDPFYQLMRQTLWAEEMVKHSKIGAIEFLHLHVIPGENAALLDKKYPASGKNMEETWRSQLKNPALYRTISPEQLLSTQKDNELLTYLRTRYW